MNFLTRLKLLAIIIFAVFFIIFLRLVYWQIGASDKMSALAEAQHFSTLLIPAKRGEILADDGSVLVGNQQVSFLYGDLSKFKSDPAQTAKAIAPLITASLPIPATTSSVLTDLTNQYQDKFSQLLSQKDVYWTVLAHNIDAPTEEKIRALNIPGLGFEDEQTRYYPEASMAAQTLGFLGSDENGNPQGYFGLEGYYDRELSGRSGMKRLEKDAFNRPIPIGSEENIDPENGRNLLTSIDKSVQRIVEDSLQKGMVTWGANSGSILVMDPYTGRVLAMASFPSYDPAHFTLYDQKLYKNPIISNVFEPGSIMKPLIVAAAVNEGKISPDTQCDECAGPRSIGGGIIRTFDNHYHPNTTMTDVLVNSDNTGMVFVGEKLGKDLLLSYLKKYQFGQKTGIDLQGEEAGEVKGPDQWYQLDLATVTFGQGIGVTALQMVRNWAVLANGGYLVTPEVVTKITGDNGSVDISPKVGPRILSQQTVNTVREMLVTVNLKSELHWPLERYPDLLKFRIAAKSGTAEVPIAGHYQQGETVGSVIGFAPADNPKFVLLVVLNEPSVRPWGSDTAGPIFYDIIRQLFLYYGISP